MNESQKYDRCYELEDKFNPLYVFSSKLKHLQLSFFEFNDIIDKSKPVLSKLNAENSDSEFYLLQMERRVIEILTHILSITECLKNKILDTNHNALGRLSKYGHDSQYCIDKFTIPRVLELISKDKNIKNKYLKI